VAPDRHWLEELITAYLLWCGLLGVKVTKVQAWTNLPGEHAVLAAGKEVATSPTFKIVGVVLGAQECLATQLHLELRLHKALDTTRRLRMLGVPAAIGSLLWQVAVLPQALYGCEVRDVKPAQLRVLTVAGQTAMQGISPLHLNCWRAPEILMGLPLGETAVRDPVLEMRQRQLRWVQLLVNLPSVVGLVHRVVMGLDASGQEPTAALAAALQCTGWRLRRNLACLRAQEWPRVAPEVPFPGQIVLQPQDTFPAEDAVFTDGSVMGMGGAAAVQPASDLVALVQVPHPRSSTHCELVALALGLQMDTSQILTDSLTALHLVSGWGKWAVDRMLRCADRQEVRYVVSLACALAGCPRLEKVKAHDAQAVELGHPKALGNDQADRVARSAASSSSCPPFLVDLAPLWRPSGSGGCRW
jgi:ribonuclease HI